MADPHSPDLIVLGSPGATPATIQANRDRMAAVGDAAEQFFGQAELTGFTLFPTSKGWQMSIRPKSELGWLIRFIEDADARRILDSLEHDPRFGVMAVGSDYKKVLAQRERETAAISELGLMAVNLCRHGRLLDEECVGCAASAAREALTAALRAWGGQ